MKTVITAQREGGKCYHRIMNKATTFRKMCVVDIM